MPAEPTLGRRRPRPRRSPPRLQPGDPDPGRGPDRRGRPDARGAAAAKAKGPPKDRAPSIIFTGDMKMLADEDAIAKTIDRIIDLAEAAGGHVAARKDTSVQIKVPSASFRQTMKDVDAIGGVTSQSIGAEDVSEELHDLDVRLANLRATRARLQELLGRAGGIPDVLTVEKELERVAKEIDVTQGRLEFLRTRTSLSLITVTLTAKPKPAVAVVAPPPPKAKARVLDVPVPWVGDVGIDPLLTLKK
ncbi:MAG: DUF4349 domain-containing protein [Labilithrix sp.]|nr:DUF4349 domain-containing protein [Labilithrix sp.]